MKFKQYLNEKELSIDEIVSLIKRDCQPYIKQLTDKNLIENRILFSGRDQNTKFSKQTVRKKRNPLDTPFDIHKWLDDWFYKKFHIRARSNTLFCFSEATEAMGYGIAYMIFPINKFDIIWNTKIFDLYSKDDFNKEFDEYKKLFLTTIAPYYIKNNFQKALKSKTELMLHCKEYYMYEYNDVFAEYILKHLKD